MFAKLGARIAFLAIDARTEVCEADVLVADMLAVDMLAADSADFCSENSPPGQLPRDIQPDLRPT